MSEVISLLMSSLQDSDAIFTWVIVMFLSVPLAIAVIASMYSDKAISANAATVLSAIVISVTAIPVIFLPYSSHQTRLKAAKLCDTIPTCEFKKAYEEAEYLFNSKKGR